MKNTPLQKWLKLPTQTKRNIFIETAQAVGLPVAAAAEKDWWVVQALAILFNSSIGKHTVFKGGTSLSKAWGLIDRFSEDIDLALDRQFLGFDKPDVEMSSSQVRKLRRHSYKFIQEKFVPELATEFDGLGLDVKVEVIDVTAPDNDPLKIAVYYPALTESSEYLQPRVLIEVGSRSLIEPFERRSFSSLVGAHYSGHSFADVPIEVPTVTPDRTFLEKIFLLHEEFQLPTERIRVERKSRHLYDLEKLMDTQYAALALANRELYETIVAHRKAMTPLKGIDYVHHHPAEINPLPPASLLNAWKIDYHDMQESMFYNPSLPFEALLQRINELKARVNAMVF